MRKKKN
jgi:hypothetical protein